MHRWVGRVAMVTGAANGIGAATAKMLVDNGMKVAAVNWMKDFKVCEVIAIYCLPLLYLECIYFQSGKGLLTNADSNTFTSVGQGIQSK